MTESKPGACENPRDCPHGCQRGKCDTCDLAAMEAKNGRLRALCDACAVELRAWSLHITTHEQYKRVTGLITLLEREI